MPATLVTPSTVQSRLDAGERNLQLDRGSYDCLYIRAATGTLQSITGSGPENTITNGIRIIGQPQGVRIANMTIRGDGIQSVDGVSHLSIVDTLVEDVTERVGIAITGKDSSPFTNLSIIRSRVRRCQIGIMLGQGIRWDLYDFWVDQCESPISPSDPAFHGAYFNDDNNISGKIHGMLVTRCGGTSFRGTASQASDLIAYQCGGTIAGSRNCELMSRFTSLDSGDIEIGSQIPCVIEDPCGNIKIKSTCRSMWLQVLRPLFASGQGIVDEAHYPIQSQDIPGRQGILTITNPQQIETLTRTPETYCRDKCSGSANLDSLWTKSFKVSEMNKWIRGIE